MLTNQEKLLLAIKTLYFMGIAIANTFAQVYLYNYTGSFFQMSIYAICRCLMILLFYYVAAKLCTKFKLVIPLVFGLAMIASSLMLMLFLKEKIGESYFYVYLIGLIWGAGEGLFWFSCSSLQQSITTLKTRSKYFATSGALSGIAGIGAPLCSAAILVSTTEMIQGYYYIFQITIVLFLIASLLSTRLTSYEISSSFIIRNKILWNHDPRWKWMTTANFYYGIRDAASFSITGLLMYDAVSGNGALYGNIVSALALASVVAYVLAGRLIKHNNQIQIFSWSSITLFLSGIILVFFPTMYGAILHGILFNFSYAFYENSFNIFIMNELTHYIHLKENINERVVVREGYLNMGRIVGFLFIMLLIYLLPKHIAMVISMTVLYGFALLVAWYMKRYETFEANKNHSTESSS